MTARGEWMQLGPHEALTTGSDLWLVADLADSSWSRKIDWYLNFQLSRASHHTRKDISPELLATSESWEFDPPLIAPRASAPLLVASATLLPNQITVQISGAGSDWVRAALKAVASLKPRAVRVFLPSGLELSEFSRLWDSHAAALDLAGPSRSQFTVVLDQGARSH